MRTAASILKEAREQVGLSQRALGRRLGVSQAAIAKLERPDSNPTVDVLDRTLRAMGRKLEITSSAWRPGIDETLIAEQLRISPDRRLAQLEEMYEWGRELALAGERARGEVA